MEPSEEFSENGTSQGVSSVTVLMTFACLYHSLERISLEVYDSVAVGVSFNQPKLCPNATWNKNGTALADNNAIGSHPQAIFINTNNTVYAANYLDGRIHIWLEGSTNSTSIIAPNSTDAYTLFVTPQGDIYIDDWSLNRINVCRKNETSCLSTLNVGGGCLSAFVDTNSSLYCSVRFTNYVIKKSLNSNDNQVPIVAGTYCTGYQPHMLNNPRGLFVTINFELYVADAGNNRIQRFQPSQLNGTTVAGSNAPGTIPLCYPTAVMLDDDGYLFILDSENYRVVGSDLYGFRCLFGCTHGCWPASGRLSYHQSMVFDSHGNIFVAGGNSGRVQKFLLSSNSCGE